MKNQDELFRLKVAVDKLLADAEAIDYLETGACIEVLEWASKALCREYDKEQQA